MIYENPSEFTAALNMFLAVSNQPRAALDRWHLIEARYPESLADWLTLHPDFEPPREIGVRIGKRPDHKRGGRANV